MSIRSGVNALPGRDLSEAGRPPEGLTAPGPTGGHAAFLRVRHFGSLDGVRCVCILAVIWHHCPHPHYARAVAAIGDRGFLGVDMFFVLSGFLIVTLLLRERDRTGAINLKNFYIRRSLRIFPLYYMLLAAVAVFMTTVKPGTAMARTFWGDFPFLVTYTANWIPVAAANLGVVWSLAAEEQFYLVWPSVERFLKPAAVVATLAAVLVVNQVANFGVLDAWLAGVGGGRRGSLLMLDVTFTPIALGVSLAHLLHRRGTFSAFQGLLGRRWSPLAVFALLLFVLELSPDDISGLPRLVLQLVMTALLASLVVREDHWARPLLASRPVAELGLISYGLYLYHMWAIHVVSRGFERLGSQNAPAFFVATLVLTVLVAEASYRLFERPILKLKSRFE